MENKTFKIGNCFVVFNKDKKVIIKQDLSEHAISKRSFLLLELLNENISEVVPTDKILTEIWCSNTYWNSRSMDVFITKLRNILKVGTNLKIVRVRGIGVKLIIE
jgi:DNA-binding response OmpR family regulator